MAKETGCFGRRMKIRRISVGISQSELAKRVGTTVGGISKYENGQIVPSVYRAAHIARALDTDLNALIGEE